MVKAGLITDCKIKLEEIPGADELSGCGNYGYLHFA